MRPSATAFVALISGTLWWMGCSTRPAVSDAQTFIEDAEARLLDLWTQSARASWIHSNFITYDTEILSAQAQKEVIGATVKLAKEATRFDGQDLPPEVSRKIDMLKTSLSLVAPDDETLQEELTLIAAEMESLYGTGQFCPIGKECLDLGQMTQILASSRDAAQLQELWVGWRKISPPMRSRYQRFAELANAGARELGFADLGELWRSGYEMSPDEFVIEVDRLWEQVEPLYLSLHAYVRRRLVEEYGAEVVLPGGAIPAHLLGNMWAQQWGNIYDLVQPEEGVPGYDLTEILEGKGVDEREMVRYGERFFTALGFEPLPETFWERSLFIQPKDRDVVCHASAWNVDDHDDLRIKMCIEINAVDFSTIHHELGHNFYQRAYNRQSPLFRAGAHDGFHEAIGDALALSVTPEYLNQIGLLDRVPGPEADLGLLLKIALNKVAFLPFGLLVDQWRWQVFSGEVPPERYNQGWWELREKYQGVRPPLDRSENDFDPGAKYHIPANTPYTRYFLAYILQFQFHRALCQAAGYQGPLHRCSIYGSEEAGRRLAGMLELGASRPWPDALEVLTGERQMDATAILDYFEPLKVWLDQQNQGITLGWGS